MPFSGMSRKTFAADVYAVFELVDAAEQFDFDSVVGRIEFNGQSGR